MDEAEVVAVAAVPVVEVEEFLGARILEEPVVEAVVDVEVEAVELQGNTLMKKSAILNTYAPKTSLEKSSKNGIVKFP